VLLYGGIFAMKNVYDLYDWLMGRKSTSPMRWKEPNRNKPKPVGPPKPPLVSFEQASTIFLIGFLHFVFAVTIIPQYWYVVAGISAPTHVIVGGYLKVKQTSNKKIRKPSITFGRPVRYGAAFTIFIVFWAIGGATHSFPFIGIGFLLTALCLLLIPKR
jgi:hypothetical protein